LIIFLKEGVFNYVMLKCLVVTFVLKSAILFIKLYLIQQGTIPLNATKPANESETVVTTVLITVINVKMVTKSVKRLSRRFLTAVILILMIVLIIQKQMGNRFVSKNAIEDFSVDICAIDSANLIVIIYILTMLKKDMSTLAK